MVKIAIIIYSAYGHIIKLAQAELEGVKSVAGVEAELLRFPSKEPRDATEAAGIKAATPDILPEYDGILIGIPTRYGSFPAQFKDLWDATGGLWQQGAMHGKFFGMFVSTGTLGGGQEVTVRGTLSALAHHGMIYVPLGYKVGSHILMNVNEVHGGSPWGAGSFAGADGSREPSKLELELAQIQGKDFAETVLRSFGNAAGSTSAGAGAGAEKAPESRPAATGAATGAAAGSGGATAATTATAAPPTNAAAPATAPSVAAPGEKSARSGQAIGAAGDNDSNKNGCCGCVIV